MFKASPSLFHRIGANSVIHSSVELLFEKVVLDTKIRHIFEGTNHKLQKTKLSLFLIYLFGGSVSFSEKEIRNTYYELKQKGIKSSDLGIIVFHYLSALQELNISYSIIQEAANTLEELYFKLNNEITELNDNRQSA